MPTLRLTPWSGSPGIITTVNLDPLPVNGVLAAAAQVAGFAAAGTVASGAGVSGVLDASAQAASFAGTGIVPVSGVLAASAQASAFSGAGTVALPNPVAIGGASLILWLNGITGTTLEGGDVRRTTGFADQSGTGNNLTTIASAQRPQCEPTGWNGDESLWFDGNDSLVSTDATFAATLADTSTDKLITFNLQVTDTATTQVVFSTSASADATHYMRIQHSASGLQIVRRGTTTKTCTATGGVDTNRHTWQVAVTSSGTVAAIWKDGVAQTLDTTDINGGAITAVRVGVGVFYSTSTTLFMTSARLAGLAVHTGSFTSQQRSDYAAWFMSKGADNSKPALLCDGNSHLETYPSIPKSSPIPYMAKAAAAMVMNIAHQGDTMNGTAMINARTTELASNYSASRSITAALNFSSVGNDILAGATLANCQTYITTWCDNVKALHSAIKTVITTIPPRTDITGGAETIRQQYNAWVLATKPANADLVVDIAALITTADLDGVHPSVAQQQTIIAPALDAGLVTVGFP